MNPDFRYIKQAFNPVAKKWEDVKEIEYKKILLSKTERKNMNKGKGGKGGKKGGRRHNIAIMAKMAQNTH